MKRRTFIKGAVAAAVSTALPALPEFRDPYELKYEWFDIKYTYETFAIANRPVEMGQRYAEMLAQSMMQTKEMVAANVFHRGGSNEENKGDI